MKKRKPFVSIDFSKCKGKYIAIVNRKIVGSGYDAERVWLNAKSKHARAQPELLKMSKGETLVRLR